MTHRIMRRLAKLKNKEQVKDWLKDLKEQEANAKWLEFCKTLQAEIVTLGGLLRSEDRWKILKIPNKKNRQV